MSEVKSVLVLATAAVLLSIALVKCAHATECPAGLPSCKILILTPDEEKLLTAPNGILDTAAQARNLDLGKVVAFFFQKIATAPQGEVKPAPEAPKQEGNPDKGAGPHTPTAAPVPTPDPRK